MKRFGLIFSVLLLILSAPVLCLLNSKSSDGNQPAEFPRAKLGQQVFIPGGNYYVGNHDLKTNPLRLMAFNGFYIDIHPVTNSQYLNFMQNSRYLPRGAFNPETAKQYPFLPATSLTYGDAEAYARHYHKRLPTEWEWEVAARGLKKAISLQNETSPASQRGNFFSGKKKSVLPVFSFPPNELGIFGLAGNVFEWTASLYPQKYLMGKYYKKHRILVLRGGAWTNLVYDVKVTTRTPFAAGRHLKWIGFRCVSDQKIRGRS